MYQVNHWATSNRLNLANVTGQCLKQKPRCNNHKVNNLQLLPFKLLLHHEKRQLALFASIFHIKFTSQMTEPCQAPELRGGSSKSSAFQIQQWLTPTEGRAEITSQNHASHCGLMGICFNWRWQTMPERDYKWVRIIRWEQWGAGCWYIEKAWHAKTSWERRCGLPSRAQLPLVMHLPSPESKSWRADKTGCKCACVVWQHHEQ